MGKPGRITDLQSRASSCCIHSLLDRNSIDNGSGHPYILASQKIPAKDIRFHYWRKIASIDRRRKIPDFFGRRLVRTRKGRQLSSQKNWPFFLRGWQTPLSCVQKCHKPDTAHEVFGQFVRYLDELCPKTTIFWNSSHDRTTEPAPNSQTHIASDREQIKQKSSSFLNCFSGAPPGARTLDPNIKSVVLYQLS